MRGLTQWSEDPLLVLFELGVLGSLSFVSILPVQDPHYAYSSVGSLRVLLVSLGTLGQGTGWGGSVELPRSYSRD